jgi:hypothetical protein
MNWKTIAALLIAIVLVALCAGWVRDSRIDTDFPSIRAKSDEASVRQLMGDPAKIASSCDAYDTSVTPDCDHVFIYRSIFYPVRGRYWLVFFDKNKQVTATSSELEP